MEMGRSKIGYGVLSFRVELANTEEEFGFRSVWINSKVHLERMGSW